MTNRNTKLLAQTYLVGSIPGWLGYLVVTGFVDSLRPIGDLKHAILFMLPGIALFTLYVSCVDLIRGRRLGWYGLLITSVILTVLVVCGAIASWPGIVRTAGANQRWFVAYMTPIILALVANALTLSALTLVLLLRDRPWRGPNTTSPECQTGIDTAR